MTIDFIKKYRGIVKNISLVSNPTWPSRTHIEYYKGDSDSFDVDLTKNNYTHIEIMIEDKIKKHIYNKRVEKLERILNESE